METTNKARKHKQDRITIESAQGNGGLKIPALGCSLEGKEYVWMFTKINNAAYSYIYRIIYVT